MAFKMKGINSLTNNSLSKQVKRGSSPLFETDPSFKEMSEEIEITDSVKDLQGKDFATGRTITTDPTKDVEKIETNNEKFLASFNNEYKKAQEGGFAGNLQEYIKQKEEKLGYKGKKVDQVRDYTSGLITKPGAKFKNKYYKRRENDRYGTTDEAFETGDFLAGLIKKGGGDGDAKKWITSEEAMRLYKRYNKQIDRPGQPKQSEMDPNDWTSIHNWNNWRKQRGLDPLRVSYQKARKPTTYKQTENKGKNWRNKN